MRLTLFASAVAMALLGVGFAAPNPYVVAVLDALAAATWAEIVAHPVRSTGLFVALIGLTFWCHDMLERRGWRATAWGCFCAAGLAVIAFTLRGAP